jgi:guanine deaminase
MALQLGQRALVGKVCMDRNSPDNYVQSTSQNIDETKMLVEYIHGRAGKEASMSLLPMVLPIITPRFIPTCSPQLMTELGALAKEYNCHIQSHISESIDELEFSRHLDETVDGGGGRSDAEILDSHQLLTERCIMAHAVHLTDSDMALMKDRGASCAHCPLSNFFFAGHSFPCRRLLERNNKVGLGTDIAGGYSPSMMNSQRMAVVASQALQHHHHQQTLHGERGETILDYRHAFYLATLGGARALGLDHKIGTLKVGLELDAFILSANVKSPIQMFDTDSVVDVFQKLCTLGDDRNIKRVYVQGKKVMDEGKISIEC